MKPTGVLWVANAVLSGTLALQHNDVRTADSSIPLQTISFDPDNGAWAPIPTAPPELWRKDAEIGGTAGEGTCGYFESSQLTCTGTNICTNLGGYRGCCEPFNPAGCVASMKTDCLDHLASSAGLCHGSGLKTLCCGNPDIGFCGTFSIQYSTEEGYFKQVVCVAQPTIGTMYDSAAAAAEAAGPTDPSEDGHANHQHSAVDNSSGPNGAVIGGAVAGVVIFVGVLGALGIFLIRRKEKAAAAAAAEDGQSLVSKPAKTTTATPGGEKKGSSSATATKKGSEDGSNVGGVSRISGTSLPLVPGGPAAKVRRNGARSNHTSRNSTGVRSSTNSAATRAGRHVSAGSSIGGVNMSFQHLRKGSDPGIGGVGGGVQTKASWNQLQNNSSSSNTTGRGGSAGSGAPQNPRFSYLTSRLSALAVARSQQHKGDDGLISPISGFRSRSETAFGDFGMGGGAGSRESIVSAPSPVDSPSPLGDISPISPVSPASSGNVSPIEGDDREGNPSGGTL